jgi:glycine cleavage system H protein
MNAEIAEGLLYTKDHEWVRMEGKRARIGITDYAQRELGDVVYVDLKPEGTSLGKGDALGTVESVKAVSDVYAPLAGTIVEVNPELEKSPELVNADCYGRGWMVLMERSSEAEAGRLMDAEAYRAYLEKEAK